MSERKFSIFPILLVNFIGTFGFSVVIPFLAFLVTKFGGNAVVYGVLGAVYPAFQLIGSPLLGKWSDIYGRKKILLLCEIGSLIGWGIFLISFYLPLKEIISINIFFSKPLVITLPIFILFLARAVDGMTGGNNSVANAYIADISGDKDRNKNFGRLSISSNVGFIAGPALAGILGSTSLGEMLPVIAALLISLTAVFIIIFLLRDSKPMSYSEDDKKTAIKKVLGFENKDCYQYKDKNITEERISLKKVLKIKFIAYFLFLNFLFFLGFNFFYTAFPIHVIQKLGWNVTQMGIFFSILSLMMVVVQGPVLNFASKKFSDSILILVGTIILGTNFIFLLSDNMLVLYMAAVLFALGNGLMWPSFLTLLSKVAGRKFQGAVQGFTSSSGALASIIGLVAGGLLYSILGAATFLISAAIIYIAAFLSFKLTSIEKNLAASQKQAVKCPK